MSNTLVLGSAMTRPHVSDELAHVVEETHHEHTEGKRTQFADALETVEQLATEQPRQNGGLYFGKYIEQAVNRLLTHQSPDQLAETPAEVDILSQLSQLWQNFDIQPVFKQSLGGEYTVTIPEVGRIAPGDSMQVITYPSESTHEEVIE